MRFACPRCRTVMQTGAEKVGYDVACPHCSHRFRLVEPETSPDSDPAGVVDREAATLPPMPSSPSSSGSWENRPVAKPAPLMPNPVSSQVPISGGPSPGVGTYACPYCGTHDPPIWKSEVSTIGWIVFAVLPVTTCVFCFVGLFIRDQYRVCSRCRVRLG